MTNKALNELEYGQKARIVRINLTGDIRRRLSDMGLVNGGEVQFERVAPLGDPIEIKVKGYALSLRKEIASQIEVIPEDMKLTDIPPGIAFRTTRIVGGQEAARRLTHMGFSIGAQATVIEKQADGPVMVNINGQQVSLGRGMAEKVRVKELPDA